MAQIKNKEGLAGLLKEGIRVVAEKNAQSIERTEQELATRLFIEPRTIKSWKSPSSVPDKLDDEKLLGLGWLILVEGRKDLGWFTSLLKATSWPVIEPPTADWLRSCLREVRIGQGADNQFGSPLPAQIEGLVTTLFGTGRVAGVTMASQLELPGQIVPLGSPYYVERAGDALAQIATGLEGVTLVIKAPRQMGKSSLLVRVMAQAREIGKAVAMLDFQRFEQNTLSGTEIFYRQFCTWLSRQLGLEDRVEEFWSEPLGNLQRCTEYMESYVLPTLNSPLMLALEEVDRLFDTPFRSDFFGMLRSWHNARQMNAVWKALDLVLVTSTQPYQFVENLTQSPFNVGVTLDLTDFNPLQLARLNRAHGSPLAAPQEARLFELVGGQPYLTRQALYMVASDSYSLDALFERAADPRGPFGEHLRYLLQQLRQQPQLVEGLRQVLLGEHNARPSDTVFWRLEGAGLVKWVGSGQSRLILPRCQLYTDFFREQLL